MSVAPSWPTAGMSPDCARRMVAVMTLLRIHRHFDRRTGRNAITRRTFPRNAQWNSLHDFHKIARRIIGRQHREARARSTGQTLNAAFEFFAAEGVDADLCALTRLHRAHLRLFEVRDDIRRLRHELHDRLTGG